MRWLVRPCGLIETVPAPIVTVHDVGAIATDGTMAQVYYYTLRPDLHGGEMIKDVVLVVNRPLTTIVKTAAMMNFLLDDAPPDQPPNGCPPHLRLVK